MNEETKRFLDKIRKGIENGDIKEGDYAYSWYYGMINEDYYGSYEAVKQLGAIEDKRS
jgi:hypothetical protein